MNLDEGTAGDSAYSNTAAATTQAPANPTIVADHTAVALYDRIPAQYLLAVKSMLVDIAGESHSSGYRIGMDLLEQRDARFASTTFDGAIPAAAAGSLRLGRHGSTGEEDFYTNAAAITALKSRLTSQAGAGNPIHVLGFGWCWDMTWHNNTTPSGTNARDPVHNVHWFGSSAGGPEGDLIWGLDDGDQALTGNSVSLADYLAAVEQYQTHCASSALGCKAIFTTGPVDGNGGSERGVQREIKHDAIRAYVQNHPGSILFDYADILAWSDAGAQNIVNWNDGGTLRPHAQIHPANAMDYDASWQPVASVEDGDHIGEVGALRLAKAMWWLLARMAGWDGTPGG